MEEHEIDKENMKLVLERFPNMCQEAVELVKSIKVGNDFKDINIAGMGGSGISGEILKYYLQEQKLPIFVVKDYVFPKHIDEKSLLFVSSYSGDTEETIAVYKEALKKGCKIVGICAGGKLEELCKENNTLCVRIPSGISPRLSTPYQFFSMLVILHNSGIIENQANYVKKTVAALRKSFYRLSGKDLASKIGKKIPIIYGSTRFLPVVMKWKTDINENAKIHAFYNVYPEFNHNEINGFVNKNGDYYIVIIRDQDDLKKIRMRMDITKKLIKNRGYDLTEVAIKGDCLLSRMFSTILLGLWVSYYLAILYETDPTPVEIIEELKKELVE